MHKELLTKEQKELLPLIKIFSNEYYLVGGTAIALIIVHRKSMDYDLFYFLMKDHFSIREIAKRAGELFKGFFNEKLFHEQLCYFEDIDYSEPIAFIGEEISEDEIKEFLIDAATIPF